MCPTHIFLNKSDDVWRNFSRNKISQQKVVRNQFEARRNKKRHINFLYFCETRLCDVQEIWAIKSIEKCTFFKQ